MDLTQDKAVGRTGDDQDEVVQPAETHMQVDDESERAVHDQANTDTENLGQQDQQMCTEEQSGDQMKEALQTSLARDTEAVSSLAQRDGVEPISAAPESHDEKESPDKRVLSPQTSQEESPAKKAAKLDSNPIATSEPQRLGEPGSSAADADSRRDNDLSNPMQDLIDKRDFAGANALQKSMERQAASAQLNAKATQCTKHHQLDEHTEAKIQVLLDKRDFAGAAALQAAAKTRATDVLITVELIQEQLLSLKADCEAQIQGFVNKADYAGADALDKTYNSFKAALVTLLNNKNLAGAQKLLKEARQTPWGKSSVTMPADVAKNEDNAEQTRVRSAAVCARSAATAAYTILEDKRSKHEAVIQKYLTDRNYQGLAAYDKQMQEMETEYRSKVEVAETAESLCKSLGATLEAVTIHKSSDTIGMRDTKAQASLKVVTTCAHLFSTETPIMDRVTIERAQVLAVGKVCSLPNKGKNKNNNKGKSKGATKGKQLTAKGKGKNKVNANADDTERQDAVSIYLGQEGYIVCVLTFGADVIRLPTLETLTGCFVDLSNAKPRAGQKGVLYFDEQSLLVECKQEHSSINTLMFEHHLSEVSQDMATQDFVQSMQVGEFVAMVLRINQLEEGATNNTNEPFLCIYGMDMDTITVGPIRLWRWTVADCGMQLGNTYVLRGLRVVKETSWSDDKWAYVPREDGAMTVECNFRTAVEDVSQVEAIMALFE